MRPKTFAALGTALVLLTLGAAPFLTSAADHLDSPITKANHALDITDIYAFDGANSKNTVLVEDVAPLAGVVSGTQFSTSGSYRFNLDTSGDDYVADTVYTFTFGAPGGRDHKQPLTLWRNGVALASGYTGNTVQIPGGGRLFAGLRDDPFFFDLAVYNKLKDSGYTDASGLTDAGVDFFAGTNILTMVLEIPDSWIGSSANFWGSTYSGSTLIDRMGKPALNTVFIDPFKVNANTKDDYNQTAPSADVATWDDQFEAVLTFFGNSTGTAETITDLLLPDVLHINTATLGKSTGTGFVGTLNGRTLREDVIDFELFVVTGGLDGHAILSTDHVDANDVAFPGTFPYLAPAH
jgi:hypothetical protein